MKRVIIESPYAGRTEEDIDLNEAYGELCMHDCLVNHNESPYASHLLYTRRFVLRDDVPSDRKLGIEAGFYWRDVAEKSIFYEDLGMTTGMLQGVEDCKKKNKPYEIRRLPDELWEKLLDYCYDACYDEPMLEEFKMELKELVEEVSKDAEITEEQAEICVNTAFKMFSEITEDELTDLFDLCKELDE